MAAKQLGLTGYRISSAAKSTLQHAAESYVTQTFVQAKLGHAKRRDGHDGHDFFCSRIRHPQRRDGARVRKQHASQAKQEVSAATFGLSCPGPVYLTGKFRRGISEAAG